MTPRRRVPPPWTEFEMTNKGDEPCELVGVDEMWVNSRYQVFVRRFMPRQEGWPPMVCLSIKTHEKDPIRDWRDMQRIKNEFCGPESEGVELYPAESRLMDTANQFFIFVIHPEFGHFPFGNEERTILDPEGAKEIGCKQRFFSRHHNADGCRELGLVQWPDLSGVIGEPSGPEG